MSDLVRCPDFTPLAALSLDTAIEPFVLIAGHGPARAARMIARTYGAFEAIDGPKLRPLVEALFGADPGPCGRAAAALATAAETAEAAARAAGWPVNGYHNVQHSLEVLLNAHYLALLNDSGPPREVLSPHERRLLLLAAVIHDFAHDGGTNGAVPYRQERRSLALAAPYLDAAGVAGTDQAALALLVLGTDPGAPARYLRSLSRLTFLGETTRPLPPVPELRGLADDDRLLRLAALLSDADLLSSAGLTPAHAARQTAKLAAELGQSLGPREAIGFFDHIVGGRFATPAGRFFAANLARLRGLAARNGR